MDSVLITERSEYDYCVSRGFEPLLDKHFRLDIRLRVEIQRDLFGHDDVERINERFYRWVWEHKPHICEETLRPLRAYSAVYVSHILSRGAHRDIAIDPRNTNILCGEMHAQWETGNRRAMRIYEGNARTIELLKKEYQRI